jgi:hypothetical protein
VEAVNNYEKKQLASFYFIAGAKSRLGAGLLVFYCLMNGTGKGIKAG